MRLLSHVRGQTMRNAYDDRCEKRRGVPALSGTPVNPRARRYKMAMTAMLVTANKEWKNERELLKREMKISIVTSLVLFLKISR